MCAANNWIDWIVWKNDFNFRIIVKALKLMATYLKLSELLFQLILLLKISRANGLRLEALTFKGHVVKLNFLIFFTYFGVWHAALLAINMLIDIKEPSITHYLFNFPLFWAAKIWFQFMELWIIFLSYIHNKETALRFPPSNWKSNIFINIFIKSSVFQQSNSKSRYFNNTTSLWR